jgi:hypothetical protein
MAWFYALERLSKIPAHGPSPRELLPILHGSLQLRAPCDFGQAWSKR